MGHDRFETKLYPYRGGGGIKVVRQQRQDLHRSDYSSSMQVLMIDWNQ